jgi:hypothetical protein
MEQRADGVLGKNCLKRFEYAGYPAGREDRLPPPQRLPDGQERTGVGRQGTTGSAKTKGSPVAFFSTSSSGIDKRFQHSANLNSGNCVLGNFCPKRVSLVVARPCRWLGRLAAVPRISQACKRLKACISSNPDLSGHPFLRSRTIPSNRSLPNQRLRSPFKPFSCKHLIMSTFLLWPLTSDLSLGIILPQTL